MTRLDGHLKQISLSAAAISDLPFPPPKIFTNALLQPHDITALIRDTEAHERALFSVANSADAATTDISKHIGLPDAVHTMNGKGDISRFCVHGTLGAGRQTAVAAVLGGDMVEKIRVASGVHLDSQPGYRDFGGERGRVDVGTLLKGAEKLCAVYPTVNTLDKISSFRTRHSQLTASIRHHEVTVAELSARLNQTHRVDRGMGYESGNDSSTAASELKRPFGQKTENTTEADLRQEEEEIRELEKRKAALETRVTGMERDLGGLLR